MPLYILDFVRDCGIAGLLGIEVVGVFHHLGYQVVVGVRQIFYGRSVL